MSLGASRYDVVVVGGGLVGGVLACALAGSRLRVAVLEAQPGAGPPAGDRFDLRVSALTLASESLLRAVGAWDHLPAERLGPFREMHVWDAAGPGAIHFDSAEIGEAALGYIVENRALQHALEQRLRETGGVEWLRPALLEDVAVEADWVRLRSSEGHLRARLAVGADGAESRLRELAGMPARRTAYGQHAVVAAVRTEREHRETAWQRFLPTGPLAFLPLPRGYSSIVWSTRPEEAEALLDMEADRFAEALASAFGRRLGAVTWVGERGAFPLARLHATRYTDHRVALVGDAAHVIHPLAGQGANLGFLDAAALAEVIGEAAARGRDIGRTATLRRYERWRKGHNLAMQAVMDAFKWLFGQRRTPVRLARNAGLLLTDRMDPVKALIMRHASGRAGDLPALARGKIEPSVGPWPGDERVGG